MSWTARRTLTIGALLAVALVVGLSRLELDVDVFSLLPADSEIVDGLQRYQRNFGSTKGLVISVRGTEWPPG